MTTKTISEYLQDERQKDCDTQLCREDEAARIQPLNGGHHRNAKQLKLPSLVKAAPKTRTIATRARKKPQTAPKKATKTRKTA
jgi:hypothetical protein